MGSMEEAASFITLWHAASAAAHNFGLQGFAFLSAIVV